VEFNYLFILSLLICQNLSQILLKNTLLLFDILIFILTFCLVTTEMLCVYD